MPLIKELLFQCPRDYQADFFYDMQGGFINLLRRHLPAGVGRIPEK